MYATYGAWGDIDFGFWNGTKEWDGDPRPPAVLGTPQDIEMVVSNGSVSFYQRTHGPGTGPRGDRSLINRSRFRCSTMWASAIRVPIPVLRPTPFC